MRGWFTAGELAGLGLPGIPTSKRGVNLMVEREGWAARSLDGAPLARKRDGREGGGGMEYHVSLLPPAARTALSAQMTKVDAPTLKVEALPKREPHDMTEKRVLRRDARLTLLTMADAHYAANLALGRKGADADFVAKYNQGTLTIEPWLKSELSICSLRSLFRWRSLREQGRWHDVGGQGRKSKSVLERVEGGDVATYVGGLLVHQPFLSAQHVRDLVAARFGQELRLDLGTIALPAERTFQRFINEWKETHRTALTALTNPDKFKSHARLAGSDYYAWVGQVNELWEIDASPADVLLKDGRYSIYVCVDVFSRRMITYVSKTARTEATLLLMRKAIMTWGVPDTVRTDNGSDFTSRAFKRALHSIGIRHDVTAPFSPEQKGIVERAIGTLQRGLMPLLPGFIGHSVADRKMIEGRRAFAARLGESADKAFCVDLTHDDLARMMDEWADKKFAHEAHGGLHGMTPFARAASSPGTIRRVANTHALDLLLAPIADGQGWRRVTKQGIRLDYGHYISGALIPGQKVFCRQDPADMGKLYVFKSETGAFIAEAICPRRAGVDPRKAVAMARAEQAQMIKDGTAELRKEAARIKPRHMVDAVLDLAGRRNASITQFPRASEDHSSEALENAADALGGADAQPAPAQSPSYEPAATSNIVRLPETAKQRYAKYLRIKAAIEAGEEVDVNEARWLGSYEQHAECKAYADLVGEHGSEWLNA